MRDFFKKHKILRFLCVILGIVIILVLAVALFLMLWPALGGSASSGDKEEYAKRAENYVDGVFYNEEEYKVMNPSGVEDTHVISTKDTKPESVLPTAEPEWDSKPALDEISVTWLGHSTLLIQMHGLNILVDPIFSDITSPVSFVGAKRFSPMEFEIEDLPQIDIVLFSHDHYDHLDYETVQKLDSKVESYVVPLGVENHLERWKVDSSKIQNMAWWEEIEVDGLTIGCAPARHGSGRGLSDQFTTLWASWILKDEYHQVYESGDTGYGGHFEEIHDKYGDFDLVLMDGAQFDMQWPDVHMFPEQSIEAVKTLGAKTAMPIHWGAFALANHAWDDPPERFVTAGEAEGLQVITPMIGETMELENATDYMERWWRNIS